MSEVRLRLDAGQEAMGPMLSEAEIPEHSLAQPEAHVLSKRSNWIAKAGTVLRRAKPPVQKPDAKAIVLAKKEDRKISTAQMAVQPQQATQAELTTLQSLHQRFRGQFLVALTTQPKPSELVDEVVVAQASPQFQSESTQETQEFEKAAVEAAPEPIAFRPLRKKIEAGKSRYAHQANHQVARTLKSLLDAQRAEAAPAEQPAAVEAVTTQPSLSNLSDSVSEQSPAVQLDESFRTRLEDQIHAIQAAPSDEYSVQKIQVSSGGQTVWIMPSVAQAQTKAQTSTGVTTQSQPANPSLIASVNSQGSRRVVDALRDEKSDRDYSLNAVTTQPGQPVSGAASFVEAFDWVSPVSNVDNAYLSKEMGSSGSGWILSQATDHWPTLARRSGAGVPLISKNTSKLLSALVGASLQSEAGIVFGKLPAGWTVRLSGRSERPVILNDRNQSMSPSTIEGERYFAFLNAAPGAHLLYLTDRGGADVGAVGLAVLGGTATYADLSVIKKVTFTGQVFDGSDLYTRPMNGVTVRVLGASSAHSETSRSGKFTIDNVMVVGDYPVYVETDASSGYTHRYQLSPAQLQNALLFRLSENAIQMYVNQLEGAISPESGVVIVAVPGIIKAQSAKSKLAPAIQTLAPNPTLRPEVYTLSQDGQMQVSQALDAENVRFVSVQVPEGPAITRVIDSEKPAGQNLLWSDMIMVSPAVVNIVGPY